MARLESDRTGWGAVDHPETGELVQLREEIDATVAETVANHYDAVWVQGDSEESAEDDDYRCGVNGCSRSVDSEDATCWQH